MKWSVCCILRIWRCCWSCGASILAALSGIEEHSHTGHLADDVGVPSFEERRRNLGSGMGFHDEPVTRQSAPAANITVAVFHEIDGPVNLADPTPGGDFSLLLIDEHQCPGAQYGIHGPIVKADETVAMPAKVAAAEEAKPQFSPALDDVAEKGGLV